MLLLLRKSGESIIVGDDIRVTIMSVRGNYVKVGFTAPPSVPIHREEIYVRIKRQMGINFNNLKSVFQKGQHRGKNEIL